MKSSRWLYCVILMTVLFSSCQLDKDKRVDRSKFSFKTGDDTLLFFKNLRQSDYTVNEQKAANFIVYRHRKFQVTDSTTIQIAIVNNYLKDEAYLLLELDKSLSTLDKVEVLQNDSLKIELLSFNRDAMLEFISQLYEGLIAKASFKVKVGEQWLPVLESTSCREAFRITVSDYYRLTRIF